MLLEIWKNTLCCCFYGVCLWHSYHDNDNSESIIIWPIFGNKYRFVVWVYKCLWLTTNFVLLWYDHIVRGHYTAPRLSNRVDFQCLSDICLSVSLTFMLILFYNFCARECHINAKMLPLRFQYNK